MSRYRLSARAETSLADIFRYSIDMFGEEQADQYRRTLLARLASLANNEPPHGRPCSAIVAEGDAEDLHYIKAGGHYVVYLRRDDELLIADFVHERRNLPALITMFVKTYG